ncbi:glycosyl transferase, partial [Gordonia sp. i37]
MSRNTAGAGRRGISALAPHRHDPVLAALDALVLIALAVLAGLHSGGTELGLGIAAAAAVVAALDMAGLYRPRLTLSALDDLPRLAGWSIVACALIVTVIRPGVEIGRAMLYTAAICFVLFALRVFYYAAVRMRRSRSGSRRMRSAVIGDGMIAVELIEATREQPGLGVDLVLAVSVDPMDELAATGVAIEQSGTGIRKLVDEYDIDALFVSFSSVPDSSLVSPLRECDELDCEIFVVPRLFEFTALNKDMDRIHTIPLIRLRRDAVRTWYWKLKRVFDLTLVSVALIVASPFLAGIGWA